MKELVFRFIDDIGNAFMLSAIMFIIGMLILIQFGIVPMLIYFGSLIVMIIVALFKIQKMIDKK